MSMVLMAPRVALSPDKVIHPKAHSLKHCPKEDHAEVFPGIRQNCVAGTQQSEQRIKEGEPEDRHGCGNQDHHHYRCSHNLFRFLPIPFSPT